MGRLTDEEKLEIIISEEFQNKFWSKVDKSAGDDKCWVRKRKPGKPAQENRYWSHHIKEETKMDAHLVSLIIKLEDFPKADALHKEWLCKGNKRCVNPEHLYDGTPNQNRRDENIAGKTKRQKKLRLKIFKEIMEESSQDEKTFFFKYLDEELFSQKKHS